MSETAADFATPVPPAIRRQAAEAARLMAEVTKPDPGADTPAGNDAPAAPGREPPSAPQAAPTPSPRAPAPAAPPAPAPAPAAPDWEQRFNTLQGKYNSEVGETARRAREAEQRLVQMEAQLQQLTIERMPAAPPPPRTEVPAEDIEAYGAELPEAARRWARAEIAPELSAMRAELAQLRGTTQATVQMTTQERVKAHLAAQVPDYEAINVDPAFIDWLAQPDPMSGQSRQSLLSGAYNGGDGARTTKIFRAFIDESGKYQGTEHTAEGPSAPPTSHTPRRGAGPTLEDLAAPGRGRPASPGAPKEKAAWSQGQIAAFYSDSALGKFRGREAEYARMEAEIQSCMKEGRITP